MRTFLAQCLCPGLVKWGSQVVFRLRSAPRSCLILNFICLLIAPNVSAQQPVLAANTGLSTDGYFVLSWSGPGAANAEFRLEESTTDGFNTTRLVYTGPDKSRVISGKPDGVYRYRLALIGSQSPAYSESVSVEVRHHSMQRALAFFFVGLVVFGAILVTVFLGMREQRGRQ